MKKSVYLLSFFLLSFTWNATAQDVQHSVVSSFSINPGVNFVASANTIDDYNSLKTISSAPLNAFVNPSDYKYQQRFTGSGIAFFKMDMGITPYSSKKNKLLKTREIRFSLGIESGHRRDFTFYNNMKGISDSLYDNTGNPIIRRETEIYEQYNYTEQFVNLNLEASYLFKTNPERRIYFYTGVGLGYSISLRGSLTTMNYKDTTTYYISLSSDEEYNSGSVYYHHWGGGYYCCYGDNGSVVKYKMNGISHFVRATIPTGIVFRISNNHSFFKHAHVFSEFQPGIELQLTNGEALANPYLGIVFVGLSYKW